MTTLVSFSRQLRRRVRRVLCVSSCFHSDKLKAGTLLTSNGAGGTIGALLSKILDRSNSISLCPSFCLSVCCCLIFVVCCLSFCSENDLEKSKKSLADKTQANSFLSTTDHKQASKKQRHKDRSPKDFINTHPPTTQSRETL